MKGRRDFRVLTAVGIVSVILAAALLAFACIFPAVMINKLYLDMEPHIISARMYMQSGDTPAAEIETKRIAELTKNYESRLLMFFDHNKVNELLNRATTAVDLALTGDSSQFLETLGAVEGTLEYLLHLNELSLANII